VKGLEALVIHPATKATLTKLQANMPQSLLISSQKGVGLRTIAKALGGRAIAIEIQPQDAKGNLSESGTISVEMIRRLYEQTRAKRTSQQLVIIDDADQMSHGAQSAFLKLLEEPGSHTAFILTAHAPDKLLATIRSRVQHIALRPATSAQSKEFIASFGITDPIKLTQLLYLADGLPAEVARLALDQESFALRAAIIGDARELLQGTGYQKSLVIQKYRNDRAKALQLIDSAAAILRRTLSAKPQQTLVLQLERLLEIRERIASNYSVSLQLMQFVLQ
jgi:replication-associated recombination protein RarA